MDNKINEQIIKHAERVFPLEACGLILDTGGNTVVLECENIAPPRDEVNPGPEASFLIDPLTFAMNSKNVIAVYHSHPNRSPKPSEADMAAAERCKLPFLIISYPSGEMFTYTPHNRAPAAYEGRSFVYGVMDCLTLVADYYHQEFGLSLNEGDRKVWGWWEDSANANAFINGFKAQGFVEVSEPRKGDLVIMNLQSIYPNHAAIYMGNSVILHHPTQSSLSISEVYGHYWRKHTSCFLRHTSTIAP